MIWNIVNCLIDQKWSYSVLISKECSLFNTYHLGQSWLFTEKAGNSKTRRHLLHSQQKKTTRARSCIWVRLCSSLNKRHWKKAWRVGKETLRCPFLCPNSRGTCLQRPEQPSVDLRLAGVLNVLWQSLNVSMKSPHQLSLLWVGKPGKHPTKLLDKTQLTCLTGLAGTWPSLWLFCLAFPSFPPPFPPVLASCHCFATAWSHSASSLQGVVKELTVTRYTAPAFIFGLFPLFQPQFG